MNRRRMVLVLQGRLDLSTVDTLRRSLGLVEFVTSEASADSDFTHGPGNENWSLAVEFNEKHDLIERRQAIESICRDAGIAIVELQPDSSANSRVVSKTSDQQLMGIKPVDSPYSMSTRVSQSDVAEKPVSASWNQAEELFDQIEREGTGLKLPELCGYLAVSKERSSVSDASGYTTRKESLDEHEVVGLARQLENMVWSWRMDDILGLGSIADPWIFTEATSERICFDTGAIHGSGYIFGHELEVESIDIPIAAPLDVDVSLNVDLGELFTRMSAALASVYGSSQRFDGAAGLELRFDLPDRSIAIVHRSYSIRLIVRPR